MTLVERCQQARRCAERVQKESELAKLEYQCEILRGKWHAAVAALSRRGGHANPCLVKDAKQWAAIIRVLEERIHDAKSELDAVLHRTTLSSSQRPSS